VDAAIRAHVRPHWEASCQQDVGHPDR
jgi:hypothetical protein